MGRIRQKERGKKTKRIAKTILLIFEGKNKTEKLYFNNFKTRNSGVILMFPSTKDTDSLSLVEFAVQCLKEFDINIKEGDRVWCIYDTDINPQKQQQLDNARKLAKKFKINIALSNPCFEIWYLLHFKYSTSCFGSNESLIQELKEYIPDYDKNIDVFKIVDEIKNNISYATANAMKLNDYHAELGRNLENIECNPSTQVFEVIEYIKNVEASS